MNTYYLLSERASLRGPDESLAPRQQRGSKSTERPRTKESCRRSGVPRERRSLSRRFFVGHVRVPSPHVNPSKLFSIRRGVLERLPEESTSQAGDAPQKRKDSAVGITSNSVVYSISIATGDEVSCGFLLIIDWLITTRTTDKKGQR